MGNEDERRKYPRIPFRDICHVEYVAGGEPSLNFQPIRNLSLRGIALETDCQYSEGRSLIIHIGTEEQPIQIKGRVAHCIKKSDNRYSVGVEFIVISPEDLEKLEELLAKLDSED